MNRPRQPMTPQRIRWGYAIVLLAVAIVACDSPSVGDRVLNSPEPMVMTLKSKPSQKKPPHDWCMALDDRQYFVDPSGAL